MMKSASATATIDAPPEAVWGVVTDVSRVAEWSDECHRAAWVGGGGPARGAVFVGHNRRGPARWTRECRVTQCDAPSVFAFSTYYRGTEQTRWRYLLVPDGAGTSLTESFEVVSAPWYVKAFDALAGRRQRESREANVSGSVGRIKAIVERAAT